MNVIGIASVVAILLLSIAAPAQAQNPKQGDYYQPQRTTPQHATRGQEQGDYYKPGIASPQRLSPSQAQETKHGDYYKPSSR